MRRTAVAVLLAGALVLAVAPPVLAAGDATAPAPAPSSGAVDPGGTSHTATESRIAYFTMAGRGYVADQEELVEDHPGPPFVWASESLELRPTVHTRPSNRTQMACASVLDAEREVIEEVDCHRWNASSRHRYARIDLPEWPAEVRGTHYLRIELLEAPADGDGEDAERTLRDHHEVQVYVIAKEGDLDEDGLSNAREAELGTDFTRPDTSGNGLTDSEEVYQYGTDPLAADTTGDGVDDGTVASLGLPPTVPYVVHAVLALTLVGLAAAAVAGNRLREGLRRDPDDDPERDGEVPSVEPVGTVGEPQTKEEEVLQILQVNDGRMRQADLVDETEWSKATVSRLLSTLEEEGRVEKIQVGRGNVVQLIRPESTPDGERTQTSR